MLTACVGISHGTADVRLREMLHAGSISDSPQVYATLRTKMRKAGISEFVMLCTCNRTELYFAERSESTSFLRDAMNVFIETFNAHDEQLSSALYGYEGRSAVKHLCRVASGIESLVIGETEVLGQVVAAHREAERFDDSGPILDELFHTAIRAGRRARAETGIGRKATSVVSESIRFIADGIPDRASRVAVIGSGKMSRLACEILKPYEYEVTIVGRTVEHAQTLADEYGMIARPWCDLTNVLADSHAAVTSTASPYAIIGCDTVRDALTMRSSDLGDLLLVDIAVPRDVDPEVANISGVVLKNMDDLQERLRSNHNERARHIPLVETIIEQELAAFDAWCTATAIRPVLSDIHTKAESLRIAEYTRFVSKHPSMDEQFRQEVEAFSSRLVKKILDAPSRRLREERDPQRLIEIAVVARELFAGTEAADERHSRLRGKLT